MLRKLTTILFLCTLFILSGLPTGKAQDPKPTSSLQAKDLAAFQALRTLVASRRHVLTDEQLEDIIGKYLKESGRRPPHEFPTATDLQELLDTDFEAFYKAMITKATSGLDPGGKLGLEDRLTKYLAQHKGTETAARSRYRKDLDNVLPANLAAARKAITDKQVDQLTDALKKYVASDKPTADDIETAFRDGSATVLADEIKNEVLRQVGPELLEILLVDADEDLAKRVNDVVSDGILQLEEQLDVLEKKPQSHTLQGIKKELRAGLESLVEKQRPDQSDPPRRHYGAFPAAVTAIDKEAKGHFGDLVAAAADQVLELVKNGSRELPEEHKKSLRQTILDAGELLGGSAGPKTKSAHHELGQSQDLLRPKIEGWAKEGRRQWTAQKLLEAALRAAEATPPKHDEAYSPQGFLDDIVGISDSLKSEDSNVGKSWMALKDGLAERYSDTLLPEVRQDIAEEQAKHYSPALVNGKWRASEREIESLGRLPSRFGLDEVYTLNVWASKPSDTKAVLNETWQQWTKSAKRELAIGDSALRGQEGVVNGLEDEMKTRIRDEPNRDVADWVSEYTSRVAKTWQDGSSKAEEHYSELFIRTDRLIRLKVVELLGRVAKEQEEEERREEKRKEEERKREEEKRKKEEERAARLREMAKPPEEPPSGTGGEGNAATPAETDELNQGGPSATGDGKAGGAEVPPVDDGQPVDEPTTDAPEDTQEPNVEQNVVSIIQNRIVDDLKLEISEEIKKAMATQGNQEVSQWADEYGRRATTAWKKEPRSGKYPELLPPVVERIGKLTAGLLSAIQASIRERVLARQMAIVEEHRFGTSETESIVRRIDDDPDATQLEYEAMFLERVLRQWQGDESEDAVQLLREYPDLLPEVKDLIRLIVALRMARKAGPTGDNPTGNNIEFYRMGFWFLLFAIVVMIGCWYWNVRYLRAYIAARRLAD